MDDNHEVVAADMNSKFTGLFINKAIDLLSEHLDSLAGNIGTEETVELVKSLKADESAGEHKPVF